MALAEYMYGDPADVVYLQQLHEIKNAQGCRACEHRGQVVLGRVIGCMIKSKPGRRGFCNQWRHNDGEVVHATADQHAGG